MTAERCSVEAYLAELLVGARPLPAESIPVCDSLGRVVAGRIAAAQPVPLFDNSAMDGYAVRTEDVVGTTPGHPVTLRVVGSAIAGAPTPKALAAGEAVRIMTGAPLPAGADRVIPVESSVSGCFDDEPVVRLWTCERRHIRRAAEDIPTGTPLVDAGRALTARDIGLLAATGHSSVRVHRRARVAIVSTGDELSGALAGGIPDSNAAYLGAAVQSVGAEVVIRLTAPDDRGMLEAVLDEASRHADLIVSSGGLGAGSHDLVRRAITDGRAPGDAGRFASVAMKPGRPQAHGRWRGAPWIALPGNPTAVLVSFEAFVRPVLDRLQGRAVMGDSDGRIASPSLPGAPGTQRFVPLTLAASSVDASHSLLAMFGAPAIGVVAAASERVAAGDTIHAFEPV
ncbi:gephyrin-like molybdotransferase Glp [Leifsonia sp. NPDC058292]|uniref:molybdopterin molybdotransferase MoeA n=1 Tax=Leifsonia sp. NPDC058292 TaxID=3346428 RepID=UPI0036DCEDE8